MRTIKISFALSLLAAVPALAEAENGSIAPAEIQALAGYAGVWKGEESWAKCDMMPEGATAASTYVIRPAVGGAYIEMNYATELPGMPFQAKAMVGWDAAAQLYKMWWFNPTGETWVTDGKIDGEKLVFEGSGLCHGTLCKGRYVYEAKSETEFAFTMYSATADAELCEVMTSTVKRVHGADGKPCPGLDGSDAAMPDCCKERAKALAAGTELPDCCKKAAEAKATGGELPGCCQEAGAAKSAGDSIEKPACCQKKETQE